MTGAFLDAAADEGAARALDETDFVIVGSGAGGGAAARLLARAGARVVVVEEGPRVTAAEVGTIARHSMARLLRNQGKFAALGRAATPLLQGRCVGGTTFVNSAIIWRLPEKILRRWHDDFGLGDGLPQAALDAASAVIEDEMSERVVTEGVNAGRQDLKLRDGAARAGIEGRFLHRYERGCRGSSRCLFGCPNDAKQSTTINYLRRAVDDGAQVVANLRVERVELRGGRAVGVRGVTGGAGRKRPFRIAARRAVLVAGGVIQSSNLLWRSGVKRPHLGDHFMAHPGTAVMGLYPEVIDAWSGAAQGFEAFGLRDTLGVKFESINVPPEVTASRMPGAGRRLTAWWERLPHAANWAVALRAEAEGTIRPSLLMGDRVSYNVLPGDLHRLREGIRRLAEMHFLAGASEVVSGVAGMPEVLRSADELRLFDDAPLDARAYSLVATHLFGGCRAGRDAATSVVDPTLKVHGVDGLYVMDASIFPTNTGVNPQHSIMAVASVAAARLVS